MTITLYQIDKLWPDEGIEAAWSTLVELRNEGKVHHIGVTTFDVNQMKRIVPIAPIMSNQTSYSILRRDPESEILPFCQKQNIV